MSKASNPGVTCPSCGAQSTGKFCSECGAALLGVTCAACQSPLTPGARFCHGCGAPAGGGASRAPAQPATARASVPAPRSVVPWAIGIVAMLALVIAVAVQQSGGSSDVPGMGANIPLDGSGPAAPFAGGAGGAIRAPDISSMSPRERADRLYDRVMRLASEGKGDSASFFATMAAQAYEMVGPLDNDLKYDFGRMSEMAGNLPEAKKQADAILASNPDHLLGLILGAQVAQLTNDNATRARLYKRLLAVEQVEQAKSIEEYTRHKGDIDAAIAEARALK
ncbi:MAG: zinc ribbon domain-containing protein [Gemmatimonadota bacterium]